VTNNPLKGHFRQATQYINLPTDGRWYDSSIIELTDGIQTGKKQLAIYPMTSLDDILVNTPDAMLNGQALEKVIQNCAPGIKDVKRIMLPDLDAIFVGIKSATNHGKVDYERNCPKCNAENLFDLDCQRLLNLMTFINEDDLTLKIDDKLTIHIKPHDFEMRKIYIKKEFEEQRTLRILDDESNKMDDMARAEFFGQEVDKFSRVTFDLACRSIEKVVMLKENITVTEQAHISEWLVNISEPQAKVILEAINKLNSTGILRVIPVSCAACGHQWEDAITFDPSSFFAKRS
jgi:hypothetical protein